MLRTIASAALLVIALAASPAGAESRTGDRHAAWQSCLAQAFSLQAALSSRALAADSALRDCRDSEQAYLAALGTSPLVDEEDVARIRPTLLARARSQLLGAGRSRQL